MKTFSNILALFVIVLLAVSVTFNIVFIPKAIRKQGIWLQAYEKPVIINQLPEMPKHIENQILRTELKPISEDTAGIRVYSDTIKNQDVSFVFTNRVQGVLLSSKLDYKFSLPVNMPAVINQASLASRGRVYAVGAISTMPGNAIQFGGIYTPRNSRLLFGYLYGTGHQSHTILLGYKF